MKNKQHSSLSLGSFQMSRIWGFSSFLHEHIEITAPIGAISSLTWEHALKSSKAISPTRLFYLFTLYKVQHCFLLLVTSTMCLGSFKKEKSEIPLLKIGKTAFLRREKGVGQPTPSFYLHDSVRNNKRKTHFFFSYINSDETVDSSALCNKMWNCL